MSSKNDKAAQARAQAKAKAQQQVRAKERRTTVIVIAVALVVIAAFAGIVAFIVNSANVPPLQDAHAPAAADATGGIPVGVGGVAGAGLTDGATRLDLYIDLFCPVCNQFEQINGDDINELREAGTINVYYHPVAILDGSSLGTKYSTRAANAVAVVADQDPEHFLDFIAALYANQPAENTAGLDDATIAQIAEGVGVPTDVANTFADGEFTKWVTAGTQQASKDGLQGTPTIMVERKILDQQQVPYFQAGTLKSYLQQASGSDS